MTNTAVDKSLLLSGDVDYGVIENIVLSLSPTEREHYIRSGTSGGAIALEWIMKVAREKYPKDEDLVKKIVFCYSPFSAAEKVYDEQYKLLFKLLEELPNKSEVVFENEEPDPVKNTKLIKVLIQQSEFKQYQRAIEIITEAVEMIELELTKPCEKFKQMKLFVEGMQ